MIRPLNQEQVQNLKDHIEDPDHPLPNSAHKWQVNYKPIMAEDPYNYQILVDDQEVDRVDWKFMREVLKIDPNTMQDIK